MKNLRMKNGFNRLTDADLHIKAAVIVKSMKDNPHFPAPSPTLEQLTHTINAYSVAVQKAQDKGHQQIAEKNSLRSLLIEQLHLINNYVLLCAAGDAVIVTSSGFSISSPRQSRPPLTTPEGLALTNGINRGELVLKLKRVANVQNYQYEITEHPVTAESKWEANWSTVSTNKFSGLVSGKEYCCRVVAYGIKAQAVYSDIVSRIVL